MQFDVNVVIHVYQPEAGETTKTLALILNALTNLKNEVQTMGSDLTALTAQVTANTTVEGSAVTALNGLAAQIASLKNDPVALQGLSDQLKTSSDALAQAIVANTPAA